MKDYEGVFITKVTMTEEDGQKVLGHIEGEITKNGGKIENVEKWGRKGIAYSIKKNKEGVYYKIDFKIEPAKLPELSKVYRLNEDILRSMIVAK